jgi:hypothetical protein
VYVPNKGGVTTWFNRDIYSTKLTGQQVGLVEATVPPGGGPAQPRPRDTKRRCFSVPSSDHATD